jgi:hypothetical protein
MGFHSFSLDPRTVLGVGPHASADEIRDAYHVKSKKHHPDLGGDEWAFRIVARAHELLTMPPGTLEPKPYAGNGSSSPAAGQPPGWTWVGGAPFNESRRGASNTSAADDAAQAGGAWHPPEDADDQPETQDRDAARPHSLPSELRSVSLELIWNRLERDEPEPPDLVQDDVDSTLSVCLVMAWPPKDLVNKAAEFPATAPALRTLIAVFDDLRSRSAVVAGRSRIEDGRFVGWLSYPDVLTAQDAILTCRGSLQDQGLSVKLQTRDIRIPFDEPAE